MKHFLLTAVCLGVLSGCVTPAPSTPVQNSGAVSAAQSYFVANRDLLAAETKWRQNKPEHYTYTLQRSCFCTPEFRKPIAIEVSEGRVLKATLQAEGTLLPLERMADAVTIEGLFDIIRRAIDDKVARIDVQYDSLSGFPASISIDRDAKMTDEEVYYTASELKAVPKVSVKAKKAKKKK